MNDEPQQVGDQAGEPLPGSDSIAGSTKAVAAGPGAADPTPPEPGPGSVQPDSDVTPEPEVAEWADAEEDENEARNLARDMANAFIEELDRVNTSSKLKKLITTAFL